MADSWRATNGEPMLPVCGRMGRCAGVAKLADARDLKSRGRKAIRVRSPVPARPRSRLAVGLFSEAAPRRKAEARCASAFLRSALAVGREVPPLRGACATAGQLRPCSQYHPYLSKKTRWLVDFPSIRSMTRTNTRTDVAGPHLRIGSSSLNSTVLAPVVLTDFFCACCVTNARFHRRFLDFRHFRS